MCELLSIFAVLGSLKSFFLIHTAFLVYWLSRYIFYHPFSIASKAFNDIEYALSHDLNIGLGQIILAILYKILFDVQTFLFSAYPSLCSSVDSSGMNMNVLS